MRALTLLALTLLTPSIAFAALVNINTADVELLDTLPGIGPAKAAAIIDYRTQHGPFAKIEDIQNVSGIGPSTFAEIKPFITVGDSGSVPLPTASSTPTGGGGSTYVPPPSAITATLYGPHDVFVHVPFRLHAQVTVKGGGVDPLAQIAWSFGDGSSQTGTEVEKVYHYPGTYLITMHARDGGAKASDELLVTVRTALVELRTSGEGITLVNNTDERIDLSGWRLRADSSSFRIPDGTILMPHLGTLFPTSITNLPVVADVTLLYPSEVVAAVGVQPSPVVTRSQLVQTEITNVAPAPHVKPVIAPAAANELAAAGALVAPPDESAATETPTSSTEPFRSPLVVGLLAVIAVAGGAFIFSPSSHKP
ncbi:MAG: helix-hairpin-helix domain-containing protein [Patescibacteria group bacterium]